MPKWEYKSERLAGVQIDNQLNFLGAQGWELVQIIHQPEETYPFLCILKKRLRDTARRDTIEDRLTLNPLSSLRRKCPAERSFSPRADRLVDPLRLSRRFSRLSVDPGAGSDRRDEMGGAALSLLWVNAVVQQTGGIHSYFLTLYPVVLLVASFQFSFLEV